MLAGTNVLGRNQTATEGLIGFFLNMVVVRNRSVGWPELPGAAAAGAECRGRGLRAPGSAVDQLVEILKPKLDPGRHPLFQVIVDYQRLPLQEITAAGLTFTPLDFEFGIAHCDLTLYLRDLEDTVLVSFLDITPTCSRQQRRAGGAFPVRAGQAVADPVGLEALFAGLAAAEEHLTACGRGRVQRGQRLQLGRRWLGEGRNRHRASTGDRFMTAHSAIPGSAGFSIFAQEVGASLSWLLLLPPPQQVRGGSSPSSARCAAGRSRADSHGER